MAPKKRIVGLMTADTPEDLRIFCSKKRCKFIENSAQQPHFWEPELSEILENCRIPHRFFMRGRGQRIGGLRIGFIVIDELDQIR